MNTFKKFLVSSSLFFAIVTTHYFVLGNTHCFGNSFAGIAYADIFASDENEALDPALPQYVPNEIIVKFKANVVDVFEQEIVTKGKLQSNPSFPASLDRLNKKYKVKKFTQIFKNFKKDRERLETLKQKEESLLTKKERHLLRRLKRAPKDAKIPDLSGIYKLKLNGPVEEAAAEYSEDPSVDYAQPYL